MPPDILRLRYRQVLGEVIAAIVRSGLPANETNVNAMLLGSVQSEDREHFTRLVLMELVGLHAGNDVRFGRRPLEMLDWKQGQTQS